MKKVPVSMEEVFIHRHSCSYIVTYSSFDLMFKLDETECFTTARHQSY